MKALKFLIITLLIFGCSVNETELKSGWWKYGEGYHLGDELDFNYINITNDTIFTDGKAIAVIISTRGTFLTLIKPSIKVKSVKTGEIGIYHQK